MVVSGDNNTQTNILLGCGGPSVSRGECSLSSRAPGFVPGARRGHTLDIRPAVSAGAHGNIVTPPGGDHERLPTHIGSAPGRDASRVLREPSVQAYAYPGRSSRCLQSSSGDSQISRLRSIGGRSTHNVEAGTAADHTSITDG